jgi:hypothetical protein
MTIPAFFLRNGHAVSCALQETSAGSRDRLLSSARIIVSIGHVRSSTGIVESVTYHTVLSRLRGFLCSMHWINRARENVDDQLHHANAAELPILRAHLPHRLGVLRGCFAGAIYFAQ